jgi:hypothetical protein
MKMGGLVTVADAVNVGVTDYTIRLITKQDAHVRGDTHDDVPMEPTMSGRQATAMITAVSRRPNAADRYDGDNDVHSTW